MLELEVAGRRVAAATGGKDFDPAKPTLLFLHGAALSRTTWMLQARYFAHHGRGVLAVDLPGCGRSQGPPLETVEALRDWVVELLDRAGVERAALVGHSMGGLVALSAAAAHPERVERLLLLGVAVPMTVNDGFLEAAERNDHLAIELMMDWAHGRSAHYGSCRVPGLWMVGTDTRVVERSGPGVLYRCLRLCNEYRSGLEEAARVACPVAVILGERDRMTPPRAAKPLLAALCDPGVEVIPDCGHMMMIERPREVLASLRRALGRPPPGPGGRILQDGERDAG